MERMTAAELNAQRDAAPSGDKRRVRGVERTVVDGIAFDSKKEGRRWAQLLLLEKGGQITNLRRQVPYPLEGKKALIKTKGGTKTRRYIADFVYFDVALGIEIIEDAKGHDTETSELKRAIMAAMGRDVVLV